MSFTFALAYTKQKDPAKGKLLKDFLAYAVGPGQASAGTLYYAQLPPDLQTKDKAAVDAIT